MFAFLAEVERTVPVDEWVIDGLRVWPLLRNYHAFSLITTHEYNPDSQIVRYAGRWRRLVQIGGSVVRGFTSRFRDRRANQPSSSPADVVALVVASTRFFRIAGRWYNPYCDSFRPALTQHGLRMGVLELAADGAYRLPRYSPSTFVQNGVFARTAAAAVRSRRPLPGEHLPGFDEMVAISDRTLGPGHAYSLTSLRFRVAQVQAIRGLFRDKLARSRPAVGLLTGYYSTDAMAFMVACRDLGIRTVEVQHGVQGEWHAAYARWARVPAGGYELLPQYFWTWDEHARDVIAAWADTTGGAHSAFVGGNPCLILPPAGDAAVQAGAQPRIRVTFTAQAFFGLPEVILGAIAASPPDWHWWIRVHPQYWETREPIRAALAARGLHNWSIDEPSDAPMASVLLASDVHVTEFSSSVLEAEALGVPSVVVHEKGCKLFGEQVASGLAAFAEAPATIVQAITQQAGKRAALRRQVSDPAATFAAGCARLAEIVGEGRGAIEARQ